MDENGSCILQLSLSSLMGRHVISFHVILAQNGFLAQKHGWSCPYLYLYNSLSLSLYIYIVYMWIIGQSSQRIISSWIVIMNIPVLQFATSISWYGDDEYHTNPINWLVPIILSKTSMLIVLWKLPSQFQHTGNLSVNAFYRRFSNYSISELTLISSRGRKTLQAGCPIAHRMHGAPEFAVMNRHRGRSASATVRCLKKNNDRWTFCIYKYHQVSTHVIIYQKAKFSSYAMVLLLRIWSYMIVYVLNGQHWPWGTRFLHLCAFHRNVQAPVANREFVVGLTCSTCMVKNHTSHPQ